jgi:ankyrin repeat protein
MAVAAYLYYYIPLGYAVSTDDLALAEKRLNWNLEGLGPNNGLVLETGSSWLEPYPLLPVAVRNGNYDMVKLLLKHDAELNPKDWDEYMSLPSEMYVKNTIYFAVENHDVEMIDFLIDLGANPEQGIYPALLENDRELLGYFLEKGAGLEFAMGVAKRMNYSQQRIDEVFSDYTAKVRGEAGQ